MKIIIAGGGTGGHIFPAIAIAQALQRDNPAIELLFVGANGKMEMEKVPKEGFKIIGLDIVGFNRSNLLKNLILPFKLFKSKRQAEKILKEFKPNVVVGVGGFASFPIMYAAQTKNIPTLLQEQNSFAGKSNKILGKRADKICVGYEGMEQFFPKEKIVYTGNPVRKKIAQSQLSQAEGREKMGLTLNAKTILIVGGSLGALSINESIKSLLPELKAWNVQLIWQTGKPYFEQAKKEAEAYSEHCKVFEFIYDMEFAYAAADIIVSRAGALASAELCLVGKPVIFVPYPYAAEDHQTHNAMALVNKNAAWMIKDTEVRSELKGTIKQLIEDENKQLELSTNIKKLGINNADEKIALLINKIAQKQKH